MRSMIVWLGLIAAIFHPAMALAEPADIDAAARGVVRVVLAVETRNGVQLLGHGTGFAVSGKQIVTNAHVVSDAARNRRVRIGVIPSEGDDPSFGKLLDYNASKDLALIEITEDLRLPPLVLVANATPQDGEVVAVGYPGVVDRALANTARDLIRAQPPVKSRGFVSALRDVQGTASILHSADIAGGNSGGPLLDECGRVLGVNSSSTLSGTGEGEFFFAIANSELLPFLRRNDIDVATTTLPCRSLAEIEQEEAERSAAALEQAEQEAAERQAAEERIREQAESAVQEERENAMALAAVLLLLAAGGGALAWQAWQREDGQRRAYIFAGIAAVAAVSSAVVWILRPGTSEVEDRVAEQFGDTSIGPESATEAPLSSGTILCTLDLDRSRVTGDPDRDVEFDWEDQGCVNNRTQYGRDSARWTRVFVPNEEDAVSLNSFDPSAREYRVERFLIGRNEMARARELRQAYDPPSCGAIDAATRLGDMQGGVLAILPDQPNERLIYRCQAR